MQAEPQPAELQHPDAENFAALLNEDGVAPIGGSSAWATRPKRLRMLETVFSNPDAGTEFDDKFFTALKSGGIMDLPQGTHQRIQRLALLSYRKNALAFASTEVRNDFVVGEGVTIVAADKRVQKVLDQHWLENDWDEKLPERTRALSIFGEQLYPAFIREMDGMVHITSITPLKIGDVERSHDDAEVIDFIQVFRSPNTTADPRAIGLTSEADEELWTAIQRLPIGGEIGPFEPGRRARQAFFFTINRVSGAVRGTPDMCSSMDWLEGLDGIIFSLLERAELTQDVVFDLLYEGANDQELRGYARDFASALRAGGIFAHNEKTKLNIVTPDLVASDATAMVSILKEQVYAGTRLHGLFLGSGGDLTRASASELSIPVAKHFETRQGQINRILRRILDYQIQESKRRGMLSGVTDFRYQIIFPRIFLRDMSTIASSLQLTAIALQLAQQNEWISKNEASNAFRKILEALGADVSDSTLVPDRAGDDAAVAPANPDADFSPGDDLGGLPTGPAVPSGPPGPKLESQVFSMDGQDVVVDPMAAGGFRPVGKRET